MRKIKVIKSGNSQGIRLSKEVEIFKRDGDIIIQEIPKSLAEAFHLLTHLSEDFFADGRDDAPPQERDKLENWVQDH